MKNSILNKGIYSFIGCFVQLIFILVLLQSCGGKKAEEASLAVEAPEQSIDANIDETNTEIDVTNLVAGRIAYDLSDSMKIGVQTQVVASITKAQNDSILFLALDSKAFAKENIMVSSKVKMTLIDPSSGKDFQIQALNSEEQFVGISSNTIWRWTVVPISSGQNTLILRATVFIVSEMGHVPKDIPVFEKQVNVFASPLLTAQQFFENNWQWLIGSSASPFLIWGLRRRFRRQRNIEK